MQEVTKTVDTPDGGLDILQNISLNVNYQEALVIKGASGSGKTTLLGLIGGSGSNYLRRDKIARSAAWR